MSNHPGTYKRLWLLFLELLQHYHAIWLLSQGTQINMVVNQKDKSGCSNLFSQGTLCSAAAWMKSNRLWFSSLLESLTPGSLGWEACVQASALWMKSWLYWCRWDVCFWFLWGFHHIPFFEGTEVNQITIAFNSFTGNLTLPAFGIELPTRLPVAHPIFLLRS